MTTMTISERWPFITHITYLGVDYVGIVQNSDANFLHMYVIDQTMTVEQKKEFVRSLLNSLLKDLIKLLLAYAIKRFKKFVKEYFASKAKDRQKRKLEKAKLKYAQNLAKVNAAKAQAQEAQEKIQKYQAAISTLTELLGAV